MKWMGFKLFLEAKRKGIIEKGLKVFAILGNSKDSVKSASGLLNNYPWQQCISYMCFKKSADPKNIRRRPFFT